MKKNNTKFYVYFGNEENVYEVEKSKAFNTIEEAIADIKEYIDVEGVTYEGTFNDSEINDILKTITEDVNVSGFGYQYMYNVHGYTIILGIAKNGYCRDMRGVLTKERREIVELF